MTQTAACAPVANSASFCCFLGSSSPGGFHSFFDGACPAADGWRVYIIKGGPGTGKSTLMRTAAAEACAQGLRCELAYCSSDPDSLDGVILPELQCAVFDGTAPHIMEPELPGVCGQIIDLGRGWSRSRLQAQRSRITSLTQECSAHHAQARRFLLCADSFRRSTQELVLQHTDRQRTASAAERLIARLCTKSGRHTAGRTGRADIRLISAVTPKGVTTLWSPVAEQCERILPVFDRYDAPSSLLMGQLRTLLTGQGYDIIDCRCSQQPERTEHIILPGQGLAFTVCSDAHTAASTERAIHSERFMDSEGIRRSRHRFASNRKNSANFIRLAAEELRQAKSVHDRLEECYASAMDFDAVNEITAAAVREILRR